MCRLEQAIEKNTTQRQFLEESAANVHVAFAVQFMIICYAQLLTAEEEALLGTLAQMKQDLEQAVRHYILSVFNSC